MNNMNDISGFTAFCKSIDCRYIENALLSDYLTFRVGGPCSCMVFPDSEEKIRDILGFIRRSSMKYFVIGRGSNLICPDDGYDGIIINTSDYDFVTVDGNKLTCSAGSSLTKVCRTALDNSLTGLEFAFGIPGSVGGAVYMDAGAYGGEMKDVIESVRYIDNGGNICTAENKDLDFSYRHSFFTDKDMFILSAVISLEPGEKESIKARMDDLIGRRRDKQPLEYPSAGSTFKRPEGYFAGALIQECNLKGFSIGGAQVSEKHAGFVINKGGATAKDIFDLVAHCRKTVAEIKGVNLETEIKVIE